MNSIRPTTSVDAPLAAAATLGLAALAVAFLGFSHANAALLGGAARSSVRAAEALPRGLERDAALARAQAAAARAVAAGPMDADIRLREARTLYLLATTAAVDDISEPLLDAASRAVGAAEALGPGNTSAAALRALIETARNGQTANAAARAAVELSYVRPARGSEGALWRIEAAVRAWDALPTHVREAALREACAQAAESPAGRQRVGVIAAIRPDVFAGACLAVPVKV